MKNITYILAFAFALLLAGCESVNPETCQDWGKQVHYSDFWFKKFVPDTLYKTLSIDADGEIAQNVELQLYKKVEGNCEMAVPTSEVQLYAGNAMCPNNVITITPGTNSIRLGLVFAPEAPKGSYHWFLKVKDGGDVEVLNGYDLAEGSQNLFEWDAKKVGKINPLANGMMLGGIGLVVLALFWLFYSRCIKWRRTKFSIVYIDYGHKRVSVNMIGKYELVCTNDITLKDSFFERVFKGSRKYEYNDFWTQEVVIKGGRLSSSLLVSKPSTYKITSPQQRVKPFQIVNEKGETVTVKTT